MFCNINNKTANNHLEQGLHSQLRFYWFRISLFSRKCCHFMVYKIYPHSIFYASIFVTRLHSPIHDKPLKMACFPAFRKCCIEISLSPFRFVKRFVYVKRYVKRYTVYGETPFTRIRSCSQIRGTLAWVSRASVRWLESADSLQTEHGRPLKTLNWWWDEWQRWAALDFSHCWICEILRWRKTLQNIFYHSTYIR